MRYARCAEGVGLDDVRTGGEVLLVNGCDDGRLRQRQQLVIAFDVVREAGKARAAIGRLIQPVLLDHGAHGAVKDQDAAFQQGAEFRGAIGVHNAGAAAHKRKNPFGLSAKNGFSLSLAVFV